MSESRLTLFQGYARKYKSRRYHCLEVISEQDFSSPRLILHNNHKPRWLLVHRFRPVERTHNSVPCFNALDSPAKTRRNIQIHSLDELFHIAYTRCAGRSRMWSWNSTVSETSLWKTESSSNGFASSSSPREDCYHLGLYTTSGRNLLLQFECSNQTESCFNSLLNIVRRNRQKYRFPEFEYVWPVFMRCKTSQCEISSLLNSGRLGGPGLFLCLTETEVRLISPKTFFSPILVLPYPFIRGCSSRKDGQFRLQTGRASAVGECELLFQLLDHVQAKEVHEVCFRFMQRCTSLVGPGRSSRTSSEFATSSCPPLPLPAFFAPEDRFPSCPNSLTEDQSICHSWTFSESLEPSVKSDSVVEFASMTSNYLEMDCDQTNNPAFSNGSQYSSGSYRDNVDLLSGTSSSSTMSSVFQAAPGSRPQSVSVVFNTQHNSFLDLGSSIRPRANTVGSGVRDTMVKDEYVEALGICKRSSTSFKKPLDLKDHYMMCE